MLSRLSGLARHTPRLSTQAQKHTFSKRFCSINPSQLQTTKGLIPATDVRAAAIGLGPISANYLGDIPAGQKSIVSRFGDAVRDSISIHKSETGHEYSYSPTLVSPHDKDSLHAFNPHIIFVCTQVGQRLETLKDLIGPDTEYVIAFQNGLNPDEILHQWLTSQQLRRPADDLVVGGATLFVQAKQDPEQQNRYLLPLEKRVVFNPTPSTPDRLLRLQSFVDYADFKGAETALSSRQIRLIKLFMNLGNNEGVLITQDGRHQSPTGAAYNETLLPENKKHYDRLMTAIEEFHPVAQYFLGPEETLPSIAQLQADVTTYIQTNHVSTSAAKTKDIQHFIESRDTASGSKNAPQIETLHGPLVESYLKAHPHVKLPALQTQLQAIDEINQRALDIQNA